MKNQMLACWALFLAFQWLFACKSVEPTPPAPDIAITSDDGQPITTFPDFYEEEDEEKPVWAAKKGPYRPSRPKKFDLIHTKLDVSFNWENEQLLGKAQLTMKPYFYPQTEVALDAKGFDIHRVAKVILTDTTELDFAYDSLKLTVALDREYTDQERFDLWIEYTAKPTELPKGGSNAITSDQGLYFINPTGEEEGKPRQIWTQGETEASSCWFPTFDAPNVKTTQEIFITVDTSFTTLSNGWLESKQTHQNGTRTDHWKLEKPHAPYLFMMAVGEFAIVKDKWNDMEVSYYVEPAYEKYARGIFGKTPEMIEFFSKKLDFPYPWPKYAQVVVRDFVSGAMENTSSSVFMEQLQVDDRYLLDDNWDGIIAHELIHHWFGNLVTNESWANLPLNEAFATYGEYLWMEHKYGREEADLHWYDELQSYLFEATKKQEPMIRYYYMDKEDMFDSHSYAKGSLLLHMLRDHIGDRAFFKALSLYLKKYAYKTAEIHDLRLVFEDVVGEDLNWFFNQWFLKAGHPNLTVSEDFDAEAGMTTLKVVQRQDSAYTPIYELPVAVHIWVNGKKETHEVRITQQLNEFVFATPAQPDLVLFDAHRVLPCDIDHIKSTDAFIFQFQNADRMLPRREALEQLQTGLTEPKIPELFLGALGENFWALREMAADAFAEYGGPLKPQVEEKLTQMALNDPNSLVRATALGSLSTLGQHEAVAEKALQDSSYSVLATALYAYVNMGGETPLDKFSQYEDLEDLSVVATIADFYSYYGIPGKTEWFIGKINHQHAQGQQLLINYIGSYLLQQPEADKAVGINFLEKKALAHPKAQVRMAAFQSLMLLNETEGVDEKLEEILKTETDPKAIELYRSLGIN